MTAADFLALAVQCGGPGAAQTAPDLADSIGGADDMADRICCEPGCSREVLARGYCSLHYQRHRQSGLLPPLPPRSVLERFSSQYAVDPATGCWVWQGHLGRKDGRGRMYVDGRQVKSHRVAYELLVGPIPPTLTIDHLCCNPACVNPAHLEPVTNRENLRRAGERRTHCIHGHEFTPENTYYAPVTRFRQCRTCKRRR